MEAAASGRSPSRALLYSMIAAMVLFWSANFIVGKVALRQFPPLLLSGLRIGLAMVFILPVYAWQSMSRSGHKWDGKDLSTLMCLGLFGVALNQLFFVLGLHYTSVAHSAILIATTPLCVLVIAAAIGQERITMLKAGGMVLAMLGVAALNVLPSPGSGSSTGPTLLGDFFVFLAGLTFALFTVFGKGVSGRHSAVTVNTFGYVSGALGLAPITLWQARGFEFHRVDAAGWVSLAYMALFPSVVCYLIYYHALKFIPASRVSAFSYLQPAIATLMAAAALGERITMPLVAGGAVIFAGVYLTERG